MESCIRNRFSRKDLRHWTIRLHFVKTSLSTCLGKRSQTEFKVDFELKTYTPHILAKKHGLL
jgi:hypothetical protein